MTQGIYCYVDKKDNSIVYIGKDSYIHKEMRNKGHYRKSLYNDQPINRILQNNINRYEYKVLEEGNISQKILNALEMSFIQRYNPKFNFTKGGDGTLGYRHTEEYKNFKSKNNPMKHPFQRKRMKENNPMKNPETVKKAFETRKRNGYIPLSGENHPMYGKKHSIEAREKMSNSHKGARFIQKQKIEMSRKKNTSGFYNVSKEKNKRCKQGFIWSYSYIDYTDNKRRKIQSIDIKKLEQKVKEKGLYWEKFEE